MENTTLKPYADYKLSGIEWLGDVPAHWEIIPNRALLRLEKELVGEKADKYILLSLTKRGIIVRDVENAEGKFPASFDSYQVVRPGDLIFCLFDIDETPRTVGLSHLSGMITGAYTRFVCVDSSLREFLYLLYLSLDDGKLLKPLYSGLRKTIPKSVFLSAKTAIPPASDRTAIVRYLDRADERIRRAISTKERLIELLIEQRQAVIHRAVTRGLNPNAPLKPSGVEWLDDVPKHWEVKKLRHILEHVTERNRPDLPLLSVVREQGIILRDVDSKEENHNFIPDDLSNYKVVNSGQFAMNKMKAWQGSFGVSQHSGIVSPAYFVFDIKGVQGKFFHRAIRSKAYVPFFGRASDGVRIGQWDLSQVRMKEIPFLTPPLPEQSAVVRYLDKATANIDTAIDKAQRQIDLLREYRTRLIADVVTGQVDVRGAVGGEDELPVS